ncbi:MAG: hypothetical protein KDA92_22475, partial [Planctomycetales bacterium]|nr:hypothetical protein [Planctomycetales bacterium]
MSIDPFGLIVLNKPAGISSRDALNRVQRLARPHKVGHAGTLDPIATGVLIVTVGKATRLTSYIHAWSKRYRGTFLLGRSSNTDDVEGEVIVDAAACHVTREDLEQVAPAFVGSIE